MRLFGSNSLLIASAWLIPNSNGESIWWTSSVNASLHLWQIGFSILIYWLNAFHCLLLYNDWRCFFLSDGFGLGLFINVIFPFRLIHYLRFLEPCFVTALTASYVKQPLPVFKWIFDILTSSIYTKHSLYDKKRWLIVVCDCLNLRTIFFQPLFHIRHKNMFKSMMPCINHTNFFLDTVNTVMMIHISCNKHHSTFSLWI